ncbi:hypothetical protein Oter_0727 [Opitutus terrae PB90-1]|uniref:DUF4177 domain-containing protein n=2 Tax=Opitutus terrae TaxID=107709 RepID=B1ZUH3_OPITP|nr:hypothetical protein Oter_0727 [Opitutus terrae PB90-1]
MALWEYKVITSGKGGFATPALLEKFLNDLGREEWEIIDFRSAPENPLAFTGLARRPTQRDWTLEDAAAAAAKAEAEKLRAEFSAKFQAATANGAAGEEKTPSFLEETIAPEDGFRKPIDTSRDSDPEAAEEDAAEKSEWDALEAEDELPSFFDALKPHMRRNQRGPGMSVGTDYLAKKWGLDESDIKNALVECGLQIPADENAKPVYVEYDGDLYWVNINRRGEVWINTREKPRPVFRVVQATKLAPEAAEEVKTADEQPQKSEGRGRRGEERGNRREERPAKTETVRRTDSGEAQPEMPAPAGEKAEAGVAAPAATPDAPSEPLPEGPALLEGIRPLMRRNRRGPGGSGSTSFLARRLRCSEADLMAGFAKLGLVLPATGEPPKNVEIGNEIWWLNQDSRGGVWINGREKRANEKTPPASVGEAAPPATAPAPEVAPTAAETTAPLPLEPAPAATGSATGLTAPAGPAEVDAGKVFPAVRLLLKETRTGSLAGKVDRVASELGRTPEDLTAALVGAGLKVPEKPREKPVFVEHAGEIFWFNRNAKGELWVNAKASKFSDAAAPEGGTEAKRPRRPRSRKPAAPSTEPDV